jgi:hypothetical protein
MTGACRVRAGDALRKAILRASQAGRPTWPVLGGLKVPRLDSVPWDAHGGGRVHVPPGEWYLQRAAREIHEDALLALRSMDAIAVRRANENRLARGQLRALAAAALRDVCDYPVSSKDADESVFDVLEYKDVRGASHAVERGRELWPVLGAWPWWGLNPKGSARVEWWEDPRVVERFAVWHAG